MHAWMAQQNQSFPSRLGLVDLFPLDTPALAALNKARNLAGRVILEDIANARITLDEEDVACFCMPFGGFVARTPAHQLSVCHHQRIGRRGILEAVGAREFLKSA